MLAIFSVCLAVAFFGGEYILSRFTWKGRELLYPLLHLINGYPLPFLVFCWLAGFVFIFFFYWKKTLGYIDTIAEASNLLVTSNEDFIHLPVELKQVEDQMNQVKQDAIRNARLAKEAEQRKNDLIVYLAHDLKTPLTSVIGYLTLLRDEGQISEELREKYLSISLDKAERLEDLINEFFEITRFNLSQLNLEISRVNLTRMLEQITYEFNPLFAAKNLQCSLHAASDIEIKCDANKMKRVFDNLICNAINYSYENSTIEISVINKQDGVYMYFRNHGNTISEEKLNRIFEQFYRLDTSRATKTGGAGLGLMEQYRHPVTMRKLSLQSICRCLKKIF
jgi:two-component system sensor histidine kinase VanS